MTTYGVAGLADSAAADVRDGNALRSAIDDCAETMGGSDIIVANAGV